MTEASPTPSVPNSEVFISYASQDKPVADAIVEALERAGLKCWIAPRDVRPGTVYADAIVGAINESKALVLVLSANAMPSAHVGREVERAASKRKQLIAFRVDMTPLSRELEYFLSNSQWIDAGSYGIDAAAGKLVDAIRSHLTSETLSTPAKPLTLDRKLISSKRRWIAIASAAVLATALAYVVAPKFWPTKHAPAVQPSTTATPTATISDKSIAVLPFVDMSEKHDQEYFSDGLSEELIDHLAHITDLKVIARTSSFAFKGKNEDMRTIATKLGVANLLEGSVRKSGNTLRITAQLIRASDGVHRWSKTYDRKLNDIFKVQDEISTTVAKALNAALNVTSAVGDLPASQGNTTIAAYNLLLQGKFYYYRHQSGDDAKAEELFLQAVIVDPHYAPAWATLARVYAWQGYMGERSTAEAEVKGRDAARSALAIDPNCAEAYYALGGIDRAIDGDWTAARAAYEKALELDPHGRVGDDAQGNIAYLKASMSGQYGDYIDWKRHYSDQNPLDTGNFSELAWIEQYAGKLNDSAVTSRKLLELNPAYATAHAQYGSTLLLMGKSAEALAASEMESDEATKLTVLASVYWAMGLRAQSDAALAALERGFDDRNEYLIAAAHAYRGEVGEALKWLDRAYHQRKGFLQDLRADPFFIKLHGDPRFDALLRKAKLIE
jgi:TolB-like protein